eukprot:CAMPEP_0119507878 /NCGR_PEP_ID=MMETSP1344-20130328/27649_1 /TAXON_ID=236787 /ORGANISM="Florenciella parvula, Strain CCMP2471" /LENGTH=79 /DNA_ID=CAMNT_0007544549 /DNA_START=37 /DNA_END=273 /DNA_ORIENTATION=-
MASPATPKEPAAEEGAEEELAATLASASIADEAEPEKAAVSDEDGTNDEDTGGAPSLTSLAAKAVAANGVDPKSLADEG